ncbi:MAG: hypothetical protein AAGG68_22065, partial [Bacteroidota bacterium]
NNLIVDFVKELLYIRTQFFFIRLRFCFFPYSNLSLFSSSSLFCRVERGKIKKVTSEELVEKINKLLDEHDFYRQNVLNMKAVDEFYTEERFMETFNKLIGKNDS